MLRRLCSCIFLKLSICVVLIAIILISDGPESTWRFEHIPSQVGKVVVVTGANTGIGFEFCRHMARANALVVMACRSRERCNEAANKIRKEFPNATVSTYNLDLSSLSSVQKFVEIIKKDFKRLDILVNNAGVTGIPFTLTEDKYETIFAVNHLGHFALTLQLLPLMNSTIPQSKKADPPRIITVTSQMEKLSWLYNFLNLDDLKYENHYYNPFFAYTASKTANIYFAKELELRLKKNNLKILSLLAHPGMAYTELQRNVQDPTLRNTIEQIIMNLGQSAEMGATPLLYAATQTGVRTGEYFGPSHFFGLMGWPKLTGVGLLYSLPGTGRKLWELSESMANLKSPI